MRDKVSPAERSRYNVRCDGPAAMVDAILALAANRAMRNKERIDFTQHMGWFDASAEALTDVPDEEEMRLFDHAFAVRQMSPSPWRI